MVHTSEQMHVESTSTQYRQQHDFLCSVPVDQIELGDKALREDSRNSDVIGNHHYVAEREHDIVRSQENNYNFINYSVRGESAISSLPTSAGGSSFRPINFSN